LSRPDPAFAEYHRGVDNLNSIYDAEFFREWGRRNEPYVRSAEIITRALHETFWPRSVADVGCGCGVYSHFFSARGVKVLSIDGVLPPPEESFPTKVEVRDLTQPIDNVWGAFDLTLCLEVAEHIPEIDSDTFLDNLVRFGDRLALSAAPPFQGGHHHVNEQPKRYWVRKLAERGFVYDRPATGRLVERLKAERPPFMWMGQHISIYQKVGPGFPVRQDLPFENRLRQV
jgi:hypothetical protein